MKQSTIKSALAIAILVIAGCGDDGPPAPVAKVLAAPPAGPHPSGFWPRWSGPNGDLTSQETGWLAKWPDDGPGIAWKADVGTGFSSVAIVDGNLFTMGSSDGKDSVWCLDASTGKEKWQHTYPCALVDNLHEGGPGATPTIDSDRVYTLSREGHLFCLNANTGKVIWSKKTPNETGVNYPDWGFTCSPLVLNEKLIVEVGRTVAFDKMTGKKLWQTDRYRPGYGSPVAFQSDGEQIITVLNNDVVLVLNAANGEKLASYGWETQYATTSTTPIVHDNSIFVSSGYGKGCALLRYDGKQLTSVYENRNMRNHMNNCVLHDGHLYGIDGQSSSSGSCRLICLDHETGKVAWAQRGFGCGSLMIADGKLIILSDTGILATAEATPEEYRELSRAQVLDGRCWTVPVLASQRIYCRDATGKLACVDVSKGK